MQNTFTVTIEKIIPNGYGLAKISGKSVFIPYALPGETVEIELAKENKNFSFGIIKNLINPSKHRIEPICPVYGICGGCDFQHISYEEQKKLKVSMFKETLNRIGRTNYEDVNIFSSSPYSYRNRIQYHSDEKIHIGFNKHQSNDLVGINNCPVCVVSINNFLSNPVDNYPGRHMIFGTEEKCWNSLEDIIEVNILQKKISFSLKCFFQSNLKMFEVLIDECILKPQGHTSFDLYSGVGIFSSFLEQKFPKVECVEDNIISANFAEKNLLNGNTKVINKKVEEFLKSKEAGCCDLAVADPPRTGFSKSACFHLTRIKPKEILYISCDYVSQCRDVKQLIDSGYKIEYIKIFDFYPQTSKMESVIKLKT